MRQKSAVLLVVLLMLVIPLAQATLVSGNVSASSMRAKGGQATGNLLGLQRINGVGDAQLPDAGFALTAGELTIVTYEADPRLNTQLGFLSPQPHNTTVEYGQATVAGIAVRPGFRFDLMPMDDQSVTLQSASPCLEFSPSARLSLAIERRVDTKSPAFEKDTSAGTQLLTCDADTTTIAGSFVLALWEYDATVQHGGQATTVQSGADSTNQAPDPAATTAESFAGHGRQQYLFAKDAQLTISNLSASTHYIYLDSAAVDANAIDLMEVTGNLRLAETTNAIDARHLALRGELHATAAFAQRPAGSSLGVQLAGHVEDAHADGLDLTTASTAPQAASPWALWITMLALAGLGLLFLGLARTRSFRVRRLLRKANASAPAKAVRLCERAVAMDPASAQTHFALAKHLGRCGDVQGALDGYDQAWRLLRPGDRLRAMVAGHAFMIAQQNLDPSRLTWLNLHREACAVKQGV